MAEHSEIGPVSDEGFLRGGRPLIEIGPTPSRAALPADVVELALEGKRGDLLVASNRVWRPTTTHLGDVRHTVGGVPVLPVAELAEYDRKQAARAKRDEDERKAQRRYLERNRRDVALSDLQPNDRLPTIAQAYAEVVDSYHGTVEVVDGDRLRIRVAPVSAPMSGGQAWREAVRVLAAAERYVAQQLTARKPLADAQVSVTGWPCD
jgi:hypothetical protein